MTQILPWIQVILSIILIFLVIIQRSADGIEGALGGSASTMTYFTRRGAEKFIFATTIVIAILFAVSAIIPLVLQ